MTTTITLESIKAEHAKIGDLIAAFEKQQETAALFFPEVTITIAPGEHYAGLIVGKDVEPSYHLVLLPGQADDITWEKAMAWASKQGGEHVASLPTRREQSLLFANFKEEFEKRAYWSCEAHESDSSWAWCQGFGYGLQGNFNRTYELRARAVRRLQRARCPVVRRRVPWPADATEWKNGSRNRGREQDAAGTERRIVMHKAHETIWLQVDPDGESYDPEQWSLEDDATWCKDQINANDVKYVRADIAEAELEAAMAEIERLENQVQARDAELWGRTQKILQLEQQLADEQAKNVGLRELVEHFALIDLGRRLLPDDFGLWVLRARKALSTPADLSALKAHDAAIWREAAKVAEDSRDKATMSKYSSVPECRAARDMAECLSKAYCHKADAIEKGGE